MSHDYTDLIARLRVVHPLHAHCRVQGEAADAIAAQAAEIEQLLLAEEGAKTAFAHVVDQKHEIERSESNLCKSLEIALEQNRALRAERDAAVTDAERYRWLRSNESTEQWLRISYYIEDELDAAIDAAIAKASTSTPP
jgi:hypothetical protein